MRRLALLVALLVANSVGAQTGSFGGLEPATGTAVGAKDPNGRMQPLRVDALGNLMTSGGSTGGGGGGSVTQGTTPWIVSQFSTPWATSDVHTTAVAPLACRLSDGAAFYTASGGGGTVNQGTGGASPWLVSQSGNFTVVQPTGTNLHVVVDAAPSTPVTGPLTDTQLRASPVPVSGTVTVASTTANQGTPAAGASAWPVTVTDTTNAVVKPGDVANSAIRVNVVAGGGAGGTSSTFGAAFPGTGTAAGALVVSAPPTYVAGNMNAPTVDTAGNLRITGTISASNPSVSTTGTGVPGSATYAGVNSGGNLVGMAQPVTDAQLGARVNTLGQKTQANSTPVVIASDQSAISTFNGTIDAGNSSVTPLGGAGVFTGAFFDTFNFGSFAIQVFSNVSSAAAGLQVQFSNDGVNADEVYSAAFTAGGNAFNVQGTLRARFVRVVYTNGGAAQATFRLQTLYKTATPSGDVLEIVDSIQTNDHAQIVRALGAGFAAGGTGAPINATVKAASTLPAATDTAAVVTVRDTATVQGTVTATQATGTNLHTVIDSGSVSATISGTPAVTVTSGAVTASQATGTNLHTVVDSGSVSISGTPAVTVTSGSVTATQAIGSNLHVVIDSGSVTAGGTVTSNQGSPGTAANSWFTKIVDTGGVNVETVKAASTAAAATDTSLVCQLNPVQPNLTTPLNVNLTTIAGSPLANGGAAGSQSVGGTAASNAAITQNPVLIAGEAVAVGTQPAAATGGNQRRIVTSLDGAQYVRAGGPVVWTCSLSGLAATLTQCIAAAGAGTRYFITDIVVGTTTATSGTYSVQAGTGTNCATGPVALWPAASTAARFNAPIAANPSTTISLGTPVAAPVANAICVIGVATNTINIQLSGFTAP